MSARLQLKFSFAFEHSVLLLVVDYGLQLVVSAHEIGVLVGQTVVNVNFKLH